MAAINKVLIDGVQPTVTTTQTLYTSPAGIIGTRIIAFTATNNHATDTIDYDVFIVPQGGSDDATNQIVNSKSVVAGENDSPVIQNHLIPPGGTLEVRVNTTATSIAFRATGIEYS